MKTLLAAICCFLFCSITAAEEPVDVQVWSQQLQAIGAKYSKGATKAQSDLARKRLVEELGGLEPVTIIMESKVKDVRWKDGVAEIYTQTPSPKAGRDAPRPAMKIGRMMPFEVRMDEASAAAIAPGAKIVFEGRLEFHAGRWGAVGRALKQQQLHTVSHVSLGGLAIGTYTSPDAKVSIGGKLYPNRWTP